MVQETLFILRQARRFGTEAGDVYQVTMSLQSAHLSNCIHLCPFAASSCPDCGLCHENLCAFSFYYAEEFPERFPLCGFSSACCLKAGD